MTKKSELEKEMQATENEIQVQIDKLNKDLTTLKVEQNEEFHKNGFSEKYYSLENDMNKKEAEMKELKSQTKTEKNDIRVIENALDESFDYCAFHEAKNNSYTTKYCSLKNKIDSFHSIPYYMFGGFIIIASCMITGSIYMNAKRREMLAFTLQQVMPVAQEGIDTMAPTIGNVAKEITKGIKEGIKDDKE